MVEEVVFPVTTQGITPKDFTFYFPQSVLNAVFFFHNTTLSDHWLALLGPKPIPE